MAYNFTAANSQYLSTAPPLTTKPYTLAAWVNPKSVGFQAVVSLGDLGGLGARRQLSIQANNAIGVTDTRGTGYVTVGATTSVIAPISTWSHMCGVFVSQTSRTAYANGGNAVTDTRDNSGGATPTVLLFGTRYITSYGSFANALIAEVGIWNAALTQPEIASLAKGMTCDKVRPQNLVFYAPLVRDLLDARGGLTLTNINGATVADHPRIYA